MDVLFLLERVWHLQSIYGHRRRYLRLWERELVSSKVLKCRSCTSGIFHHRRMITLTSSDSPHGAWEQLLSLPMWSCSLGRSRCMHGKDCLTSFGKEPNDDKIIFNLSLYFLSTGPLLCLVWTVGNVELIISLFYPLLSFERL